MVKRKKKRTIKPDVLEKGQIALAEYRAALAAAKKKGGKFFEEWKAEQELKRKLKRTTPMQAIKAFCLHCVGDIRVEVTKCTARQCPLYIYRPYQKGDKDE